jgi:hypothetical protein
LESRCLLSIFTVTNTGDNGGVDPAVGAGTGTLRQAIVDSNADTDPTGATIDFSIPAADSGYTALNQSWTIAPTSPLPALTNVIAIDGSSQPGFTAAGHPVIVLSGASEPNNSNGLDLHANGITIRSLVVNGFSSSDADPIHGDGLYVLSNNNTIVGNYIGTDSTGTTAVGNQHGVALVNCGGNTIGGTTAAARNIISGNAYGIYNDGTDTSVVQGNYIGTDVAGTHAIPNGCGVQALYINMGDQYGGTAPGAGNVISGNGTGLYLQDFSAPGFVEGNLIGTDVTGTAALGNGTGIWLAGPIVPSNGMIGGINDVAPDGTVYRTAGNLISGNGIGIRNAFGNAIEGNYIGTDITGTKSLGNGTGISSNEGFSNTTIGGTTPGARNIISGNGRGVGLGVQNGGGVASGNLIEGNYIGTDVTGTHALGNNLGITVGHNSIGNIIGGTTSGARNIISGNFGDGIDVWRVGAGGDIPSANLIEGNYVGTDVTGTVALGNRSTGVDVIEGVNNTIAGNVIAGNGFGGVWLGTTNGGVVTVTGNVVQGNLIGTDAFGMTTTGTDGRPLGNAGGGVMVVGGDPLGVSNNLIGGSTAAARNVISGNQGFGVEFQRSSGNLVEGNFIGADISGTRSLGNAGGVILYYDSYNNTIGGISPGQANIIANSTSYGGVDVSKDPWFAGLPLPAGTTIRGNSIHDNSNLGIDLGADGVTLNDSHTVQPGPNNWQNFPVLSMAYAGASTVVLGTLHSTPSSTFIIDFYANPTPDPSGYGQGQFYLGSTTVTTDSNGNASLTATGLGAAGPGQWISATSTDPGGDTSEFCQDIKSVPAPTVLVLNPSASGALTLSGNASVNIPGIVAVDSSSSTALSAAGNSQLTATTIDVLGGVKTSGSATVSPVPTTGASIPDLLAGLSGPSITGLANYGSADLTGGSLTISPGIYSQIKVSGSASLTLNSGIYIIEGDGLTVTGGASITGTGVMIYNAGSNYPGTSGKFGGITLSGTGTFNLSAPTSGPYAGVLIFQSRQDTRALSFSGNAMAGMNGTIYAANALVSMSGNALLTTALDVGMLNLSGNMALTQTAAGSDGTGDTSGIANSLLAGDLAVYINDPSGLFTQDELARIQDAINTWNTLLAPYSVTITEVTDPTPANMVIDIGTLSASGGMANGVLGCFNEPNSEITMIQGWNWYAGADPTQIGPGQYDFETTVLHELGHALGLGGATDPTSPMYETLAAGTVNRTVTVADLNIPEAPAGADPQTAARFNGVPAEASFGRIDFASTPAVASRSITIGIMPLTSVEAGMTTQAAMGSGQSAVVSAWVSPQAGFDSTLVIQAAGRGDERALKPWIGQEVVDLSSLLDGAQSSTEPAVDSSAESGRPVRASGVNRADKPFAASKIVPSQQAVDWVLDELVAESRALSQARGMAAYGVDHGGWTALLGEDALAPSPAPPVQHGEGFHSASDIPTDMLTVPLQGSRRGAFSSPMQPTDLLLKAGVFGLGAWVLTAKALRSRTPPYLRSCASRQRHGREERPRSCPRARSRSSDNGRETSRWSAEWESSLRAAG